MHRILKQVLRDSAEGREGEVQIGRGVPVESGRPASMAGGQSAASPWAASHGRSNTTTSAPRPRRKVERNAGFRGDGTVLPGPVPEDTLHDIAEESSQAERRADDAERELMDWKKVKFMQDRVGEEFEGLIVSVTKFGFFVELKDLFNEGLVPLSTLEGDRYVFHENTKQIIGVRSKKAYSLGDTVQVIVDRIDPVQKKLQFAVVEERPAHRRR